MLSSYAVCGACWVKYVLGKQKNTVCPMLYQFEEDPNQGCTTTRKWGCAVGQLACRFLVAHAGTIWSQTSWCAVQGRTCSHGQMSKQEPHNWIHPGRFGLTLNLHWDSEKCSFEIYTATANLWIAFHLPRVRQGLTAGNISHFLTNKDGLTEAY